jgi:4'-phosphopantetheinyl transferase
MLAIPRSASERPAAQSAWPPGPARPLLASGALHVWRADLNGVADDLSELLSRDEQARAERFLSRRRGRLWARARGVLRTLLGVYLEVDPRALCFATGKHGKPAVVNSGTSWGTPGVAAASGLSFNLSHSGTVALYAFSAADAVGVDLEVARRPVEEAAMARPAFGESRHPERPDARRRDPAFLRRWVRHEATLKCWGVGIGGASTELRCDELWIVELGLGPLAAGAVAVERPPRDLRCWAWSA